jgi:lipid-A-disaccharide synthase-like uncharacterized protein
MLPYWIIGSLAIVVMEASYVPQILRVARRKSAEDVSIFFPALNLVGRVLAVAYALSRGDSVFVLGFLVGAMLRATLLVQVAYYRHFFRPRAAVAVRS